MINDYLFNAWRKEDRDIQVIRVQNRMLVILLVLALLFFVGWITAPSRLMVYIPPDISNGATLKAGAIPKALIYSFTYQIFQELNYWPVNGETNYPQAIQTFSAYLTPQFKNDLLDDNASLEDSGELNRSRILQGLVGSAFDDTRVKALSKTSWEVDLPMRLTEYKNNLPVKDVEILYPLKVVQIDFSIRNNPYGLVLAGFTAQPKRLQTFL